MALHKHSHQYQASPWSSAGLTENSVHHAFHGLVQIVISESHHAESFSFDKYGSVRIGLEILWQSVLASVQFDNELCIEADKIHDIRADRLLPPKLESCKAPIPQGVPELALDIGLFTAKTTRQVVLHM